MNRQQGATMIEVLVTILVLAVGLLGLSATQVMSMKNGNNAHHRYLAALAAQEMAERLRSNLRGMELAGYDGQTVDGTETSQSCSTACTPSLLASMDLYEWGQLISTNLPGGTGSISRSGRVVTLTVSWKEQHTGASRGSGTGLDDSSFRLVVEL